ncbi:hypothetical protein [Paenibacillus sp. H1-7]|nr:hypothetical protein [Paenibacillus sp. H1-7]
MEKLKRLQRNSHPLGFAREVEMAAITKAALRETGDEKSKEPSRSVTSWI